MRSYRKGKLKIIENENYLKIKILEIDDYKCKYKCNICGVIKTATIGGMMKNMNKNILFHNEFCSKYFNDIIRNELGENNLKQFRGFYRYAHERCFNPNNKDFYRYKGKFLFQDYTEYFHECYELYKKSKQIYPKENLSIDRINNNKGYEKGNIRFVPMSINIKNRDCYYPVMAINILTKEIFEAESLRELARVLFDINKTSAMRESINENRLYLKDGKSFIHLIVHRLSKMRKLISRVGICLK